MIRTVVLEVLLVAEIGSLARLSVALVLVLLFFSEAFQAAF